MGMEERVRKIIGDDEGVYESYHFEKVIGRGGFAEVRLVSKHNHLYAMKVPLGAFRTGESSGETIADTSLDDLKNFSREALNWARISDRVPDAAVRLIDFNIDPFPWMVMELAECDFKTAMKNGEVGIEDILDLLEKLQEIHNIGIIHRDIKPENILKVNGHWKFSDFGLSKSIGSVSKSASVKGTPEYMAPEQFMPKKLGPANEQTDLWQMGVLTYHILFKKSPYQSEDYEGLILEVPIEGPDTDSIPEQYRPLFNKAFSRDRTGRFKEAREFSNAIISTKANVGSNQNKNSETEETTSNTVKISKPETQPQNHTQKTEKESLIDIYFEDAMNLYIGTDDHLDVKEAYHKFESGRPRGRIMAATMMMNGEGTNQDIGAARREINSIPGGFKTFLGNDAASLYISGRLHEFGLGLEQSYKKAFEMYRGAAAQGYTPAMLSMGRFYEEGLAVDKSIDEARRWYEEASKKNVALAKLRLSNLAKIRKQTIETSHASSRSIELSKPETQPQIRTETIETSHADSEFNKAMSYYTGQSVNKDLAMAYTLFSSGNSLGKIMAATMKALGEGTSRDPIVAYGDLSKILKPGFRIGYDPASQYVFARAHEIGIEFEKSYEKAFRMYKNAADLDYAPAMYSLGRMYEFGNGTTQSYASAARWYLEAANKGVEDACISLGKLYIEGKGVSASYSTALDLLKRVTKKGNLEALFLTGTLYEKGGLGVVQNKQKAEEIYRECAEKGHLESMYRLGYLYENGVDYLDLSGAGEVTKDLKSALKYYSEASARGHPESTDRMKYLKDKEAQKAAKAEADAAVAAEETRAAAKTKDSMTTGNKKKRHWWN